MRHQKYGRKLNRNTNQRKALFRDLIQSLIMQEEIRTTEAKAKTIKKLVDKLIVKTRSGTLHVRRQATAFLWDKKAANKLIDDVAKRFTDGIGGFTKMIRLGPRRGDNAMLVKMELVNKKAKVIPQPSKTKAANSPQKRKQSKK